MELPHLRSALAAALLSLPAVLSAEYGPSSSKAPEPPREMRAAWIATVHNLDWPSKYTLSASQQQAELIALLDLAQSTGLNAVVLQVRTECDAFYKSKLEPWSWFLTGSMNKDPGYDPLAFAIEEAHQRGLELHAWFNPFRASATERSSKSSNHITRTHPSLMLKSGSMKWGNPGSEFIRKRAVEVMVDVAARYDVDAVHIDDYFYPYPKTVNGKTYDQFDDSASYWKYKKSGGKMEVGDWRRYQINDFVSTLYSSIKKTKPHVEVGISPFGIWRPGYPSTVKAGLDAYGHIYADSRKWLQEGWLDYFSPQLYWRIYPADQSFTALNSWWGEQNVKQRHLFPGIASNRILSSEDKGRPSTETIKQIEATRKYASPMGAGHLHWSIKAIQQDKGGLRSRLRAAYSEPSLPPPSPWLGSTAPSPVYVAPEITSDGVELSFKAAPDARWRVIQVREGSSWRSLRMIPGDQSGAKISGKPQEIAIRNVSASGMLSVPTVLKKL